MTGGEIRFYPPVGQRRSHLGRSPAEGYLVKLLTLAGALLFLAAACAGTSDQPPYNPDPSWKPRAEYCYVVTSDPRGDHNTRYAFADDATLEDGTARAANVRVTQLTGHHQPNDPADDFFRVGIAWVAEDGTLGVEGRCK